MDANNVFVSRVSCDACLHTLLSVESLDRESCFVWDWTKMAFHWLLFSVPGKSIQAGLIIYHGVNTKFRTSARNNLLLEASPTFIKDRSFFSSLSLSLCFALVCLFVSFSISFLCCVSVEFFNKMMKHNFLKLCTVHHCHLYDMCASKFYVTHKNTTK